MIVNIPFTSVVYASSLAITTKHIVSLTLSVGKSVVGRSTDMYDRLALTVCSFLRDWSLRQLLSWSNPNRTVQDLLLFARVGFWKEHEILNELDLKTVSTPNSWFLEAVIKYDVQYRNIICSDTYDICIRDYYDYAYSGWRINNLLNLCGGGGALWCMHPYEVMILLPGGPSQFLPACTTLLRRVLFTKSLC